MKKICMRAAVTLLLLTTCALLQAQKTNAKFSASTQMFLREQARRSEAAKAQERQTTNHRSRPLEQYIASPDTIDGTAYISCFRWPTRRTFVPWRRWEYG